MGVLIQVLPFPHRSRLEDVKGFFPGLLLVDRKLASTKASTFTMPIPLGIGMEAAGR